MRFMALVTMDETMLYGAPPPELFEALQKLSAQARAEGWLVDEGGLLPSAMGARVHAADGDTTVVDGPFAEAKEIIGGYAILDVASKQEAIERACEFVSLHMDHLPGWKGTCEVRQLVDGPVELD